MKSTNQEVYLVGFLLLLPLAAFSKGSYEVAIIIISIGFIAHKYLNPFLYLKKDVRYFNLVFFGTYLLSVLLGTFQYYYNLSETTKISVYFVLSISLLPFLNKLKRVIEKKKKIKKNNNDK